MDADASPPADDPAALLRAVPAARRRGDLRAALALAGQAAALADAEGDAVLAAEARAQQALLFARLGDLIPAVEAGQHALGHFTHAGPPAALAHVRCALSFAYERAGLHALAYEHAARALDSARACGDAAAECNALQRLGLAMDDADGQRRGLARLEQSLALARGLADPELHFMVANNLARRWVLEADRLAGQGEDPQPALHQAQRVAEEASALAQSAGSPFQQAMAASNLGGILRRQRDIGAARQAFHRALALAQAGGYAGLARTVTLALQVVAVESAPSRASCAELAEGLDASAPGADPDLQRQARRTLVDALRQIGDLAGALHHLERLHAEVTAAMAARMELVARLASDQAGSASASR